MSLINEALKKAQRQRLEEGADPSDPSSPTSGRMPRRRKPQSSNTVVLLASAGLVLVVLSVVFTVYLVNRPSDAKRVAVTAQSPASSPQTNVAPVSIKSAADESAPAIVVPKITPVSQPASTPVPSSAATISTGTPAVAAATPSSAPTPVASAPRYQSPAPAVATPSTLSNAVAASTSTAPASAAPVPYTPAPTPTPDATIVSAPAVQPTAVPSAPAAPTLPPGVPDERVAAFVESIRVTGIRSSGAESRVLMNERVYRVNDVVERNLGVRLVKAAADSLTFSDPRGVTYVKNF